MTLLLIFFLNKGKTAVGSHSFLENIVQPFVKGFMQQDIQKKKRPSLYSVLKPGKGGDDYEVIIFILTFCVSIKIFAISNLRADNVQTQPDELYFCLQRYQPDTYTEKNLH